jgi:hypothetical protein
MRKRTAIIESDDDDEVAAVENGQSIVRATSRCVRRSRVEQMEVDRTPKNKRTVKPKSNKKKNDSEDEETLYRDVSEQSESSEVDDEEEEEADDQVREQFRKM